MSQGGPSGVIIVRLIIILYAKEWFTELSA
jgi:hypothetical protein